MCLCSRSFSTSLSQLPVEASAGPAVSKNETKKGEGEEEEEEEKKNKNKEVRERCFFLELLLFPFCQRAQRKKPLDLTVLFQAVTSMGHSCSPTSCLHFHPSIHIDMPSGQRHLPPLSPRGMGHQLHDGLVFDLDHFIL